MGFRGVFCTISSFPLALLTSRGINWKFSIILSSSLFINDPGRSIESRILWNKMKSLFHPVRKLTCMNSYYFSILVKGVIADHVIANFVPFLSDKIHTRPGFIWKLQRLIIRNSYHNWLPSGSMPLKFYFEY